MPTSNSKNVLRHVPSFQPSVVAAAMRTSTLSMRAVVAEFIAMTFFVYAGCGTAVFFSSVRTSNYALQAAAGAPLDSASLLGSQLALLRSDLQINGSFGVNTALAFGMAIMVLVYTVSHISGGHLNPAVTLSLFLSGHCGWVQAIGNMVAQFAGALLAAGLLYGTTPNANSSSLGANSPAEGINNGQAVLGEIVMTCLLCTVVHMCAVDKQNRKNVGNFAPLAIGFAVFLGHAVLIPVDGCSINPARSFGPAAVSGDWADGRFWIFIVGPFVGAIFAVPLYFILASQWEDDEKKGEIGVERTGGAADKPVTAV